MPEISCAYAGESHKIKNIVVINIPILLLHQLPLCKQAVGQPLIKPYLLIEKLCFMLPLKILHNQFMGAWFSVNYSYIRESKGLKEIPFLVVVVNLQHGKVALPYPQLPLAVACLFFSRFTHRNTFDVVAGFSVNIFSN